MGLCLTELDKTSYHRLLSHASAVHDFAYVGSVGGAGSRGRLCGFSAYAETVINISSSEPRAEAFSSDRLAEDMEQQLRSYQYEAPSVAGFLPGGWIGFLSYEMGYVREKRLAGLCPAMAFPLFSAGFYLWTASHNRETGQYYLWVHPECPLSTQETLRELLTTEPPAAAPGWAMPSPFIPRQSPEDFRDSVRKIQSFIEAGDCYQANLSQEFSGHYEGDPWQAFRALAEENPTPYSGFIRAGDASILSISPERFLEIEGRTVNTSPIKGTRPRGSTPESDCAYAADLEASEKDLAENLMIVDLLRNDLSLNAKTGSVRVDKLFALESYRNVHHLVSHIRAELADGITPMKALLDAFPGGSITGAPKIRAMEIIRQLEPHWRGPYCGSVFYWGLNGSLDSNIAIRTLLCDGKGMIRCWGGGGIVADSGPEAEYQETLAKVGPLMRFLEYLVIP